MDNEQLFNIKHENTSEDRHRFTSSEDILIKSVIGYTGKNQGNYVFFRVNVNELFNINLKYPGVIGALNKALMESKRYVPVDFGLTKRSYKLKKINSEEVECFFDPKDIIGKVRYGKKVKENYTIYIAENATRMNWISIVQKHFLDELYYQMRILRKKSIKKKKATITKTKSTTTKVNKKISTKIPQVVKLAGMAAFMESFNKIYQEKKRVAREAKKQAKEDTKNKLILLKLKQKNDKIKNKVKENIK